MTMAARVREWIAGRGKRRFRAEQVLRALGLSDDVPVRNVLTDMLSRGEIERVDQGVYRMVALKSPGRAAPSVIRPRVYRAMHVKGVFSAREISKLTDARIDTVRKIAGALLKGQEIEEVCIRRNSRFSRERIYRIRHLDRFYLKYILDRGDGDEGDRGRCEQAWSERARS